MKVNPYKDGVRVASRSCRHLSPMYNLKNSITPILRSPGARSCDTPNHFSITHLCGIHTLNHEFYVQKYLILECPGIPRSHASRSSEQLDCSYFLQHRTI